MGYVQLALTVLNCQARGWCKIPPPEAMSAALNGTLKGTLSPKPHALVREPLPRGSSYTTIVESGPQKGHPYYGFGGI